MKNWEKVMNKLFFTVEYYYLYFTQKENVVFAVENEI
jgi:hypothetical protein